MWCRQGSNAVGGCCGSRSGGRSRRGASDTLSQACRNTSSYLTLRHNRSATVLFSFLTLEARQLELLNEIAPRKTVIDDLLAPID